MGVLGMALGLTVFLDRSRTQPQERCSRVGFAIWYVTRNLVPPVRGQGFSKAPMFTGPAACLACRPDRISLSVLSNLAPRLSVDQAPERTVHRRRNPFDRPAAETKPTPRWIAGNALPSRYYVHPTTPTRLLSTSGLGRGSFPSSYSSGHRFRRCSSRPFSG